MPIQSQSPSLLTAFVASLALAATTPARAQDQRPATKLPTVQPRPTIEVPKIRYTEFTLRNGLRVLLHEDHSSPIVATEVWYKAGSKYDFAGKTGIAHMFEHIMDEGTLNMPSGEFKRTVQSAGGYYNAMVTNDIARYWTTAPSDHLETVLWLEAERMANLGPAIDSNRVNLEREAIRNEYRQRVLNSAPQSAAEMVTEHLFPGGSYAVTGFGRPAELSSITVSDLRRFYDTYYVPNNAVLVVVGDLTVADARKKIEKHFGAIPRGKPLAAPPGAPALKGEKRLVLEHPANVRGLWSVWRGAPSASPDRPALLALSHILTQRLTRLLIDERKISTIVSPVTNQSFDLEEAGVFQVAMTPNATTPGAVYETILDSIVASIKKDGVTPTEVRRWVASYRMQMLTAMQSDSSKASNLGDATSVMNRPLGIYEMAERAQLLTPAQVQAAARKYLTGDRLIISIIPPGKFELVSKPELPYLNVTRKPGGTP